MSKEYIEVGVVGQPNVGKSTLFNVLTGRKVHVANWPGVTVEKHVGERIYRGRRIVFVDLPGIYGFSATTIEERIARKYILTQQPDVLLVLVDSLNPERTMYLAIQALEITPRVILVFTKVDSVHAHGIHINYYALSSKLGVPVVPVSSATGAGIVELLDTIIDVKEGRKGRKTPLVVDYKELNPFIDSIVNILREKNGNILGFPIRWVAVRLLEGDVELEQIVQRKMGEDVLERIRAVRDEVKKIFGREPSELLSIRRFEYINEILKGVIVRVSISSRKGKAFSYFYKPIIGPTLGLTILFTIFILAFTINTGFPLNIILDSMGYPDLASAVEEYSIGGLMESGFDYLSNTLYEILGDNMFSHFLIDGIIGGVGSVLVFLPLIMVVALMLAILEDSGLAPRIAVSLHGMLSKIGVSGHAIFPMMLSLGCNVPGIMATRASPNLHERLRLMMTIPFIPCQARLVVILAFASALTGIKGLLLIIYGYIAAFTAFAITNKLLYIYDKRKHKIVEPEILLELPPLHKPIPRVVWWQVWDATKHFLVKAGTIIFFLSIIIWISTSYTPALTYTSEASESIAAYVAKLFAPLLSPIGLSGDPAWIMTFALLIGFVAKEAVIGALTIVTGASSGTAAIIQLGLNDAQIAALTVFSILYVPCLATLAVIQLESRSWKITLSTIALMLSIAYVGMMITYLLGLLI
ncbi:ferrous iron transport protein B [Staphylothermus hellenicus]|uniref:Ferrous iron transport protein B n=1 Tax=Staphylothermus hellenicus (strain DSM 12710 / JCM 10830 / BK20S6-10-b1 / P8) TaxID=591019 RepID=D7D840_STAHD|nr:ferrous iron transport protein B [Staphylothermus hellenicus]ADI31936.1 small GTP-binding protein [Staphylothermus hellenicus DSM 12710]